MGAFLLAKQQNTDFSERAALAVFTEKGLTDPHVFTIGKWQLWSWKKINLNEDHFIIDGKAILVCAGTPVYQGTHDLKESLNMIMHELGNNSFSYNKVRGSYGLLYSPDGNEIKILTDQAGIWNIYFDTNAGIISSSFLAVVFGLKNKVSLNKFAATEVITSGRLIGPDTLFNEISRLEISLMGKIGECEILRDQDLQNFPDPKKETFSEAVDEQIEAINNYFADIKNFGNYYGVDSGLTGGHDSRMMFIQIRKYFKKFQIHSFWRKTRDLELAIAEKVAAKAGVPLRVVEGKHHADKTNEQLEDTLKKGLFFYDGHIRMHCFLMEDYHTIEHRTKILDDKNLGINGIGGEQYRNEWHMELPAWRLEYFTRYSLCYILSGKSFTDTGFENKYFDHLRTKLVNKLGMDINSKKISKKYVQKYYNEVYVASLMSVRTNAENALTHFITPFIDRQLTRVAYRSLPHHGISFDFQQAMIRKMDPELASVQSGYGYSFTEGEPFKKKLKYLVKEFTPTSLYMQKLDKKFEATGNKAFQELVKKYPIYSESVKLMQQFKIPIDETMITSRPDIMPVYLSLSYFLYYLSKQNKLEIT
ncbi:MAG: hypothetical protein ABI741_05330 [Ferruginibacter sp.]